MPLSGSCICTVTDHTFTTHIVTIHALISHIVGNIHKRLSYTSNRSKHCLKCRSDILYEPPLSVIAEIVKQHKNKKHKYPAKIKSLYNFITGQACRKACEYHHHTVPYSEWLCLYMKYLHTIQAVYSCDDCKQRNKYSTCILIQEKGVQQRIYYRRYT